MTSLSPRFPFTAYPTGWFVVATSEELEVGELLTLRYFGQDLVAFRSESGQVSVLDAYCPHLGAHLGHGGVVEGGCVRCPFHGWRFDGQGDCVEVPYSDRIPPKAAIGSWPVLEQDGMIFVFYRGPHRAEPWPMAPLDPEGYTPGKMVHWRNLATHPQEVFENTADITHIGPVHRGRGARVIGKPERDGHKLRVNLEFHAPGDIVGMPEQLNDVHLDVNLFGLGAVVVLTHVRNADIRARQRLYATPVDETHIDIRGVVQVRITDDPVFTEELADLFYRAYVEDFAKDFPIWENKRYLTRPVLAKGDGPIGLYRRWCTQFYDDRGEPAAADVDAGSRDASAHGRGHAPRPDLPLSAPGGAIDHGPLLRRVSGRVLGTARQVLSGARERAPWLEGPLSALDRLAGTPGRHNHDLAGNGAQDDEDDDGWRPEAAGDTDPPPPASAPAPVPAGARVASAHEYFETLHERFVPSAARGVDAVFQWELAGDDGRTFHAVVRDGLLEVYDGPHAKPTVALAMDARDYVKVVNGDMDGMKAFTSGRGKVKGSVRAAMKMRNLFPAA